MKQPSAGEMPRCNGCVHYFISHDPNFPYGCRALGFRSRRQPVLEVVAASAQGCLYFQARPVLRRPGG